MSVKRRDNKNRVLRNGESQKKTDDMSINILISNANHISFILGNLSLQTGFLLVKKMTYPCERKSGNLTRIRETAPIKAVAK